MSTNVTHQHRSDTNFKQTNKSHKTGKHDSKSTTKKKAKGKVEGSSRVHVKDVGKLNKLDRRNQSKQSVAKNKEELVMARRKAKDTPRIVTVISLGTQEAAERTWKLLLQWYADQAESTPPTMEENTPLTLKVVAWKQRLTFIKPAASINAILDTTKVADIVLVVIPADGTDELGNMLVSLIKGQGLPTVIGILQGLEDIPPKQRQQTKKQHTKFFESHFTDECKFVTLDSIQDAGQLIRFACSSKLREVRWREIRPYMLADKVEFTPDVSDYQMGTLKVSGFLRGGKLNVNHIVHIPDMGDFQLLQVDRPADPYTGHNKTNDMDTQDTKVESPQVLAVADSATQESLQYENVPDTFASEQTWPTEEELKQAEHRMEIMKGKKIKKFVPKGTSSYQAAWLLDSEDEDNDNEPHVSEEEQQDEENDVTEDKEQEPMQNQTMESDHEEEEMEELVELKEKDEELEKDYQLMMEEQRQKKLKQSEEDLEFPDEIDTPIDIPARIRFQKYRGLKSFRSSPWDPKENLPPEYSKIFQFQNFARAKKRVLSDAGATVEPDQFVTLQVSNVSKTILDKHQGLPIVVVGLLQHESKLSVLHINVMKHPTYTEPVKSKEPLIFYCGFRRYKTNPIFSEQNANCDKHKYEKFLHAGRTSTIATVYGPIMFPPVPLLILKETNAGNLSLVATGCLHSVNPDRIILKKIILTGYPFKIFKRYAIIRQMFFSTEDINWFKPVEVYTKMGRTGHIQEPLGTHGHMKVQFDSQITNNDTVCMNLYKRVYPKWNDKK